MHLICHDRLMCVCCLCLVVYDQLTAHWYMLHTSIDLFLSLLMCDVHVCVVCLPAGVSLAAAGVYTLGEGVMQSRINHIQTDWFLMYLTAWIPVHHMHKTIIKIR